MSDKYRPLERFLRATPSKLDRITLSFQQIEQLLGEPLPDSHITFRQWWENQRDFSSRPQARSWIQAGFEVAEVVRDPINGWVRFRRMKTSAA